VKIIFAGTPGLAAKVLSALIAAGFEIPLVITRPDALIGRKGILTPSAVAVEASKHNLPILKTEQFSPNVIEEIRKSKANVGVVVAFGVFLPKLALSIIEHGWFNLHFSLLPKYRGAAPAQHALLNGDRVTGVTIFQIDQGMDTGPIALQIPTEVAAHETAARLLDRLTELGITGLKEVLPQIAAGTIALTAQTSETVSQAPKLHRGDAKIDWTAMASDIENAVCAFNPEPYAYSNIDGLDIKILQARAIVGAPDLHSQPAQLHFNESRVLVTCGAGTALELIEVQPAGKKAMAAIDWFRGLRSETMRFD